MISLFTQPQKGIAIAPILMAIALLAVIVGAFMRGADTLGGGAVNQDRIVYELRGQIDTIRTKIEECVLLTRTVAAPQFEFPGSTQIGTLLNVAALDCPRDPTGRQNLWQGARPSTPPSPIRGFEMWKYMNHGDPELVSPGGICISIQPVAASASDKMYREAIKIALKRYSSLEVTYNPADPAQRIIIWLRRPNSGATC